MLGAALDKKLCWELGLIIGYTWSCVRQKAMLGAALDKNMLGAALAKKCLERC